MTDCGARATKSPEPTRSPYQDGGQQAEYEKGNRPPRRYIVTGASVRLQTPDGVRRFPAGTMFVALSFIPVNEEHKVPPGTKVGQHLSTEEVPLSSTVAVAWPETPAKAILWESEPSLRQKIARAEPASACYGRSQWEPRQELR